MTIYDTLILQIVKSVNFSIVTLNGVILLLHKVLIYAISIFLVPEHRNTKSFLRNKRMLKNVISVRVRDNLSICCLQQISFKEKQYRLKMLSFFLFRILSIFFNDCRILIYLYINVYKIRLFGYFWIFLCIRTFKFKP